MSTKLVAAVALAALAAVVVLTNLDGQRAANAQMPGQMKMVTRVLEGNFRVHYDCAFIDNTNKKDSEELIKKIEFHPEYIVLVNQYGGGRVIPVHAIKELTWEPT